jgi:hypothetical protein
VNHDFETTGVQALIRGGNGTYAGALTRPSTDVPKMAKFALLGVA